MQLARVRFTVGMLLVAVAVVAANLWGFRRFYETQMYEVLGRGVYRVLPVGVGALPLFNVALMGTWLFAAKRLRSTRHGRAANSRSSLPGVAYFAFQFLLLGGLVDHFMPDAIQSVQASLDVVTKLAAQSWGSVFREPGGTVPWIIFESSILGVLISGPPLLLSWIGKRLAMRCAATLPRRRVRAMICLATLGFASVALAICLTPRPFEEEQEVALDFQVVDEDSGLPVTSAFVCITDPFSHDPPSVPPRALTDNDGRARLTGRFVVRGECNAFQTLGVFSPWGRWLEVSAAGHRTLRIPLSEVLGAVADPARPGLGKVTLDRGESREGAFQDLAGFYLAGGHGFGGRGIEIKPDGRFAWCEWGCVPPDSQEYGYLRRHDAEIEFVPVPHPGREIHPLVTCKHRTIEWGERLYLSVADEHELREFCREALTPNRPSKSDDTYGSYLRQSDRDKPRSGLPRLPPKVWVGFLIDEVSLPSRSGGRK